MEFWLEHEGKEIWAIWPKASTLEDASSYLLGPVLGVLLRLRGTTCLHASAVAIDGQAVAFAGTEGAGKSTTAAAFARVGHSVLSDDVVALKENESGFVVAPAYPHICLWPDSVRGLGCVLAKPSYVPPQNSVKRNHGENLVSKRFSLAKVYRPTPERKPFT